MFKSKNMHLNQVAQWFLYPKMTLPIWITPTKGVFGKLTGDVYQQWAFENDYVWQFTDLPLGVNRAFPTSGGLYAWFFSTIEKDNGLWVRQAIFERGKFEIPRYQPIGLFRGAISSKSGVISSLLVNNNTILSLLSNDNNATVYPIYELEGDWELRDANLEIQLAVLLSNENENTAVMINLSNGKLKYFNIIKIIDVALNIATKNLLVAASIERDGITVIDYSRNKNIFINLPSTEVTIKPYSSKHSIIRADIYGRSKLYLLSLIDGEISEIKTPKGSIPDFTINQQGNIYYLHSNMMTPPHLRIHTIRSSTDKRVGFIPPAKYEVNANLEEIWVPITEGSIHVFISKPKNPRPDNMKIFLIHGGPHWADFDEYSPIRASWVDAGYTVIQVNYRGSLTYGLEWKEKIYNRAGNVEIEDIMSVKSYLDHQLMGPSIISGESWGGLIALLAVAKYPRHWQAAIAHAPIADPIRNYFDETPLFKEMDHILFGGTPITARNTYLNSSPFELANNIQCPVMIISGDNDERCGLKQIEAFVDKLSKLGGKVVHIKTTASHILVKTKLRIQLMKEELDFVNNPDLYIKRNSLIKYL
ncbi:alpha/beta hydrolase family protein [Tepidibacillus infernus]|uniref:alpha/beta hydrolase family protein n=1 Tax=Tepidibacillus infernus TaxID=1806172 RepID=UPI003B6C199C